MCRYRLHLLGFIFVSVSVFLGTTPLSAQSNDLPEVLREGYDLLKQTGPEAAVKHFETHLSSNADDEWAKFGLAFTLRWVGKSSESMELLSSLEEATSDPQLIPLVLYQKGILLSEAQFHDAALEILQEAKASYLELGNHDGAIECDLVSTHVHILLDQFVEAKNLVNQLRVQVNPDSEIGTFLLYLQSSLAIQEKEWRFALVNILRAHQNYKKNGDVFYQSLASATECFLYLKLGEQEKAFEAYARSVYEFKLSKVKNHLLQAFLDYLGQTYFGETNKKSHQGLRKEFEDQLQADPNYHFEEMLKNLDH